MMDETKISIIIPVYNEEKTIKELISKVLDLNFSIKKEVIVVNDASRDNTRKNIESVKGIKIVNHQHNQGKGAAVRTGLRFVTGEIIAIQDADLEYDPADLKRLLVPILGGESKVVYGSRWRGDLGNVIFSHYWGNQLLTLMTRILYFHKLTDMETCYKVFRKEILEGVTLKANSFDFEPEITAKILKKGYKILELPITYKGRTFEEGKKINWRDGLRALYVLFKFRFIN